jgi:hypothetical protein
MQRSCDSCGKPYEAKRKASKFCSDTCRKRAQRSPKLGPVFGPTSTGLGDASVLYTTIMQKLEAVGRVDTVAGQQALTLAGRMSSPSETGAAVASLSRQLSATMAEALAGTAVAADPMDELKARRERKHAG